MDLINRRNLFNFLPDLEPGGSLARLAGRGDFLQCPPGHTDAATDAGWLGGGEVGCLGGWVFIWLSSWLFGCLDFLIWGFL